MITIYVIITALVPTALVKGSMECNFSGPTGAQQCFGALGEPLIFHLPTNVSKITLKKNETAIISTIVDMRGILHKEYINHAAYFTNGTFKLNKAQKRDSGNYQLQVYASDGTFLHKINMHLEIQAPVTKPAVSQMCLSPEQMNISCSSEGDGVEIILTLDGQLLIQTRDHCHCPSSSAASTLPLAGSRDEQHKPGVSNVAIGLHGQLTGNIMCTARNHVSKEETVIHLTSCKAFTSHLSLVTVAVIASVATLLLTLAVFLGIKHLNKKTRPMTVNEDKDQDEIVYSDVRVKKHTRKTRPNPHQN